MSVAQQDRQTDETKHHSNMKQKEKHSKIKARDETQLP